MALLFYILSILNSSLYAETILIQSHYPNSAYITQRLLPFSLSTNSGLKIENIRLFGTEDCQSLTDPFYPTIFHIYCFQPATMSVTAECRDANNQPVSLSLGTIVVTDIGQTATSSPTENSSPFTKPGGQ